MEAIMATVVYRLVYIVSYWLTDTSWGCAFGVGGPEICSNRGADGLGDRARINDDRGHNGYHRVSFWLHRLALIIGHLLGVRFRRWKARGKGTSRGE
jgi:hypothetical protein